ncbi:MAG: zf-TFIIB domain-containing protein [Pseudomonadales bacterium]
MSEQVYRCPKCKANMVERKYAQLTRYYQCDSCRGLMLPREGLEALRQQWLSEVVVDTGDVRVGRVHNRIPGVECPSCECAMERIADSEQAHVHLDFCAPCDLVYLDAGELTDLKQLTLSDYILDFFAGFDKN